MKILRIIAGAVIVILFAGGMFGMGYNLATKKNAYVVDYKLCSGSCDTLKDTIAQHTHLEIIKLLVEIKECVCDGEVPTQTPTVTEGPTATETEQGPSPTPKGTVTPPVEATPTPTVTVVVPTNTLIPPTPTVEAVFCHCEQGEGEGAEDRKNCHPVKYNNGHANHEWDYWSEDGTCDGWHH